MILWISNVIIGILIYELLAMGYVSTRYKVFNKYTDRWFIPQAIKNKNYKDSEGFKHSDDSAFIWGHMLPFIMLGLAACTLFIVGVTVDKEGVPNPYEPMVMVVTGILMLISIHVVYPLIRYFRQKSTKTSIRQMLFFVCLTKEERTEIAIGTDKQNK